MGYLKTLLKQIPLICCASIFITGCEFKKLDELFPSVEILDESNTVVLADATLTESSAEITLVSGEISETFTLDFSDFDTDDFYMCES